MNTTEQPPLLNTAAASGRLVSLDFIRGVAVLGIVIANVIGFGQPFLGYSWPGGFATPPQISDNWLWAAQLVLIDGKMRGLFTLLFGVGLALFGERAAMRGEGPGRQARRLSILLLFGLAHFYLLWRGDILALYAMCGFIVMLALPWPPIIQFSAGLVAYVAGALSDGLSYGLYWRSGLDTTGPQSERADAVRELAIAENGNYADYVLHAWEAHRWDWLDGFIYTAPETIPLMLIGAALYRIGLFDGRIESTTQRRWGWGGAVAGTLATLALALWAVRGGLSYTEALFVGEGPLVLLRLPVVLGLAALLALWGAGAGANGWLGSRITAAGRMAFSNYLGTSLAMLLMFQAPGGRLYGDIARPGLYLVAFAVCALMMAWSQPWLARFHYGPLEWAWRCLTYQRRFPFRRKSLAFANGSH